MRYWADINLKLKAMKEKIYYAIAEKVSQTYGHGDYGEEIHICPINAYMGNNDFHPIFENEEDAKIYMEKTEYYNTHLKIIKLKVYEK